MRCQQGSFLGGEGYPFWMRLKGWQKEIIHFGGFSICATEWAFDVEGGGLSLVQREAQRTICKLGPPWTHTIPTFAQYAFACNMHQLGCHCHVAPAAETLHADIAIFQKDIYFLAAWLRCQHVNIHVIHLPASCSLVGCIQGLLCHACDP